MAKKESYKDSIKKRADLKKVAEEVASIDDQVARIEATTQALKAFDDAAPEIRREHRKYGLELEDPKNKKTERLFEIYKRAEDAAKEAEKGKLNPSSVDEYVQQIAGELMPHMFKYEPQKEGEKPSADSQLHAVEAMKYYLMVYDQMNEGKTETYAAVRNEIAKGNASGATKLIISAIMMAKERIEAKRFQELLIPLETDDDQRGGRHYEFMLKAAEKIKKDVESQMGEGTISVTKIAKDRPTFLALYDSYANKRYKDIAEKAKSPKKPSSK